MLKELEANIMILDHVQIRSQVPYFRISISNPVSVIPDTSNLCMRKCALSTIIQESFAKSYVQKNQQHSPEQNVINQQHQTKGK